MIALDTNILARFYCEDPNDPEADRQRPSVLRLFHEAEAMFVPITVVVEFEWIMRGFYERDRQDFARVIRHLLGLSNVTVEDWQAINDALTLHLEGLDIATGWWPTNRADRTVQSARLVRPVVLLAPWLISPWPGASGRRAGREAS